LAKVTVTANRGFDMRDIDFSNLYYGSSYTTKSSVFAVHYSGGGMDEFRGTNFKYNSDGVPIGGTVKSYAAHDYNGKLVVVDGLNIAATKIVDAADTFSTSDDFRLIKAALSGNDVLTGGKYDDYAMGYDGNDKLSGKDGSDHLIGGNGKDTIIGGGGRDYLTGGAGADNFLFLKAADSNLYGDDKVRDFSRKEHDKIDLSAVDANGTAAGNGEFHLIGDNDFSGQRGQLRIETKNGVTRIQGDTDGNGLTDFTISLDGRIDLAKHDFDL
jgi:serralysin